MAVFSPDGRLLLTQQGENLRMLDLASGKTVWTKPHRTARGIWISPDGLLSGVSEADGRIGLFDARSGIARTNWLPAGKHHLHTLSADGRWLATGQGDTTILLWDMSAHAGTRQPIKPAALAEIEKLWTDVASEDAVLAYSAMERLAVSPEGIAFVGKQLKPIVDEGRVQKLVEELDSRRFTAREAASRELQQMGAAARPALAAVLAGKPTLEVRRRIEALLTGTTVPDRLVPAGEPLRRYRSIQLLEWAGTPEARTALDRVKSH